MYSTYRSRQPEKKRSKFWLLLIICAVSFFVIKLVVRDSQSGRVESQETVAEESSCFGESCEVQQELSEVQGVMTIGGFSIDSFYGFLKNEYPDYKFETCDETFSWSSYGSVEIEGKALSVESSTGVDRLQQSCLTYLAENEFIGSEENTITSDGGKNVIGLVKDSTKCLITTDNDFFEVVCGK
jgi:hypothetical protein